MCINREEMFAPIACVIRAKNYDEAVQLANDTEYGLVSGIITRSLARARDFRRRIKTGCVTINLPTAGTDYHVPFGGRKNSSYGPREQGQAAAEFIPSSRPPILTPVGRNKTPCRCSSIHCNTAIYLRRVCVKCEMAVWMPLHVTVCYHENFRETTDNIARWNDLFRRHGDLIQPGRTANDVQQAKAAGRTAIFFGLQNCTPMEGDIRLLEILHTLGVRFMQLAYNQQSLLASGCFEDNDNGVSRAGREAIAEMNRLGMVVDLSHAQSEACWKRWKFPHGRQSLHTLIPLFGITRRAIYLMLSCALWRNPAGCLVLVYIRII